LAQYKVAVDAGHGGSDSGAVFGNRKEKDDTLRLANAVGKELEKNGVDVYYIRTTDEYETPFKKATDANNAGADYFLSIHRNSSDIPGQYTGAQSLVYDDSGIKAKMARNINAELEKVGFKNLGIDERPNLVVLKRTKMPSVLTEVGFINNKNDNELFDNNFDAIAKAIADGVLSTINPKSQTTSYLNSVENGNQDSQDDNERDMDGRDMDSRDMDSRDMDSRDMNNRDMNNRDMNGRDMDTRENKPWKFDENNDGDLGEKLYRVQVGAYRNKESADRMLNALLIEGFPAFIVYDEGIYKVQVGAFRFLANAIKMEERLRKFRYNTYITV